MATILAATCDAGARGYACTMVYAPDIHIVTLVIWIVQILIGAYMWGRASRFFQPAPVARDSRLPSLILFVHPLLALSGLGVWIAFMETGAPALAWVTFGTLLVVAGLGEVMFVRWFRERRERHEAVTPAPEPASAEEHGDVHLPPAERAIPPVAVGAHGLLAVTTIVLVFISALMA